MQNQDVDVILTSLLKNMSYAINLLNRDQRFYITDVTTKIKEKELFYQDDNLQPVQLETFSYMGNDVVFAQDTAYINKHLLSKIDTVKKEDIELILNKDLNAIEISEKEIGSICLNEVWHKSYILLNVISPILRTLMKSLSI